MKAKVTKGNTTKRLDWKIAFSEFLPLHAGANLRTSLRSQIVRPRSMKRPDNLAINSDVKSCSSSVDVCFMREFQNDAWEKCIIFMLNWKKRVIYFREEKAFAAPGWAWRPSHALISWVNSPLHVLLHPLTQIHPPRLIDPIQWYLKESSSTCALAYYASISLNKIVKSAQIPALGTVSLKRH